jgi:hypothetical protein
MVARIPVRKGPYQYVLVGADGTTETISVTDQQLDAGWVEVEVSEGQQITEVALSSTSDPDLDPARGELWPTRQS